LNIAVELLIDAKVRAEEEDALMEMIIVDNE
jgi:hypothetical protein